MCKHGLNHTSLTLSGKVLDYYSLTLFWQGTGRARALHGQGLAGSPIVVSIGHSMTVSFITHDLEVH